MKNLPSQWTHEDLFKAFSKFGDISSAKVSIDANFKSRGYGFVEFKEVKSAVEATKEMDGQVPSDSDSDDKEEKPLIVAKFEAKK